MKKRRGFRPLPSETTGKLAFIYDNINFANIP